MNYTKGEWKVSENQIRFGDDSILAVINPNCINAEANARLIAAAPDMYLAGQGLDHAIGSAIIEIAKVTTLNISLLNIINAYILPAQENWRKALAKAEGKVN